ncbi:MAG: phosphoribosyltransferase family protein [Candidatus Caldarchaeum sp.]|nr:phosphoribosyltransferase family protein [Candidatus Caldarchaeum sp.]MDW8435087.1 phosphoribosyltransferase family protein [Candidatus Caldarchaeum sp.]
MLEYDGRPFYDLVVRNFRRQLPLVQVSPDTWIAYFDSLGDREFIAHCAKILADYLKDCEILVTSESKGIPLVHEIASLLGHPRYIVCRKERKAFMKDPITVNFRPITSSRDLELVIDGRYIPHIKGKKVGIVDDIVSTKNTMEAMEKIVTLAGGIVAKKATVLVEGEHHKDVFYLGVLPIFKKNMGSV